MSLSRPESATVSAVTLPASAAEMPAEGTDASSPLLRAEDVLREVVERFCADRRALPTSRQK